MAQTFAITCRSLQLLALCAICIASRGTLHAQATGPTLDPGDPNDFVILSNLLQNEPSSVTVGDKVFSMFSYSRAGDMPEASAIKLFGFEDEDGNFGFSLHGGFLDMPGGLLGSTANLGFLVSVSAEGEALGNRISDAHLFLNGQGIDDDPNSSVVSVDESFSEAPEALRVALSNLPNQAENIANDSVIFGQNYLALHSSVVIYASAGAGSNQFARTTAIDMTFSQIVVPEPATALLMLAGVASMVLGRSRRS